jgi:hypothetical protein
MLKVDECFLWPHQTMKSILVERADFVRILSIYSNEELKIAIPFMIENHASSASVDVILERAKIVGNLPRYILTSTSFDDRQRETSDAITQLKQEERKEILSVTGLSQSGSTIAGCIFAVTVSLNIISNASYASIDNEESFDENKDVGQVISHERAGYDGCRVCDYGKVVVNILSKSVLEKNLRTKSQAHIVILGCYYCGRTKYNGRGC